MEDKLAIIVPFRDRQKHLDIFVPHIHEFLKDKGIDISFKLVGNYMTSLEMPGFSISLLKLDDELSELLNEGCDTPTLKL